ncbi:MAG: hypothetical protein AAF628_05595 [Planctomycetota bacterium]
MRSLTPSCVALGLLVLGSCSSTGSRVRLGDVASRFAATEPLRSVRVAFPVGSARVLVAPAGSNEVRVSGEIRVVEERLLEWSVPPRFEEHVVAKIEGGELIVGSAHDGSLANDFSFSLEIEVPAQAALDVEGDLAVGNFAIELPEVGRLDARVSTGNVSARCDALAGPVEATTGVGNVDIAVRSAAPQSGVRLATATGDVTLALPDAAEGSFDLTTSVGSVSAAARYGIDVERNVTSARGRGGVGQSGPTYSLSASVGSVRLR